MSHVVHLGDCVAGMKALADGSIDHVITDPPYSVTVYMRARAADSKSGSGTPKRIGKGLKALAAGEIGAIDELIEPVADEIARLVRRWALVFSDIECCHRWRGELESSGLRYIRTGAWVKPDAMPQMTGDRPGTGMEPCTIAHAVGGAKLRWNGGGRPALWTHGTEKKDRPDHPCPKPIALMEQLIRDFTDPGDLILDPFAGSGTTGVACKRLGRRFIGFEIDPKFHAAAQARIDATSEQLELVRAKAPRARQGGLFPKTDEAA